MSRPNTPGSTLGSPQHSARSGFLPGAIRAPLILLAASSALAGLLLSCTGTPTASPRTLDATTPAAPSQPGTVMIDPADTAAIAALLDRLTDRRVVFVGETHDRYDHHLNQLTVIRGLYQRGVPVAIGMEQFQRPFQRHLDDFIAGRIGEAELLARTEWDQRWRFDPALYRDIWTFARERRIPIIALNAATETVRAVSNGGIDGLPAAERALFPAAVRLAEGPYRAHLTAVVSMHGHGGNAHLTRFLEVQYLWDQTMARTAADYMNANPERTLVVLAGSGHLAHDDAIPARVRALAPGAQAVLLTDAGQLPPGAAPDYVFAARPQAVAPPRRLAAAGG